MFRTLLNRRRKNSRMKQTKNPDYTKMAKSSHEKGRKEGRKEEIGWISSHKKSKVRNGELTL